MRALGLEPGEFVVHGGELLVEVGLRAQAMVAGKGVDGEVADEQRGEEVKRERGEDGVTAPVTDHGAPRCRRAVKAALMRRQGSRWRSSLPTKLPSRLPRLRTRRSSPLSTK